MTEVAFAVLILLVLAWAVVSDRLARWNVTGPLLFTVCGFVLGNPTWGPVSIDVEAPSVHHLAEVALALLLFSDAARVNLSMLRRDISVPARLLGFGLPLSVLLGALVAAWLFIDFSWALAGLVGAALAPTDAALSAQVINDKRIRLRVRRALNVESGLNDGIVTPIVVFTIAVAASQLGVAGSDKDAGPGALLELGLGVLVGLVIGLGSAKLIGFASRRRWVAPGGRRLATLAAALGSFALALTLEGNGFIAAFVAGIAFGAAFPRDVADLDEIGQLPELIGEVLGLAVWFLFGAALVPIALDYISVSTVIYGILSLTVIRLVPVWLGMAKSGLDGATVLFMGWFGPRGLASVVFALLAVEGLGESEVVGEAVGVIAFTVLLSVILHGVSAGPLGRRYALGHKDTEMEGDATGTTARRQINR